jgi:hypothetical protein
MASGCDQASMERLFPSGGPIDCDGMLEEIGLRRPLVDLSFGDVGEPVNLTLMLRALKLHFFEGVFGVGRDRGEIGAVLVVAYSLMGGVDAGANTCACVAGGEGKVGGCSIDTVWSGSTSSVGGKTMGGK